MSYDNMDHVDWMECNIAAAKRRKPTALQTRRANEARGWLAAPDVLNPFQRRAITLIGVIGNGIYNAPVDWETVVWRKTYMVLQWRNPLATFDFNQLTVAVMMAHDAAIRLAVAPKMRCLEITLHQREPRTETSRMSQGHPTLAEAVADHQSRFPAGHPIHYQPAPEPALAHLQGAA
ncbi:hypothetical protein ACJ4V0_16010 [Phreatobacter sp. HK31-P]